MKSVRGWDVNAVTIYEYKDGGMNEKHDNERCKYNLLCLYIYIYIYTEGYSESTEPIDAVNILPLARFEPTTSTTPPSTTPDIDATNCATETSPKKDVQEALILTTPDAVHVVYWFFFNA